MCKALDLHALALLVTLSAFAAVLAPCCFSTLCTTMVSISIQQERLEKKMKMKMKLFTDINMSITGFQVSWSILLESNDMCQWHANSFKKKLKFTLAGDLNTSQFPYSIIFIFGCNLQILMYWSKLQTKQTMTSNPVSTYFMISV
jgi:hypothetical protein